MGLLTNSEILSWDEHSKNISSYKDLGILQFIRLYNCYKLNTSIPFFWGYEMEYMLIKKIKNNYKLNLIGSKLIDTLSKKDNCWLPEYADWMIEKIPKRPFNNKIVNLLNLEKDLQDEINTINLNLDKDSSTILMTSFPLTGINEFHTPIENKYNDYSCSKFIPDNIINPHIRFRTLTKNIRTRRGKKVNIEIPIYKDINTPDDVIYMDCMGFGMGNCCSQVTIQCHDLEHALKMYDQFAVLTPFLLALSSACPILKGSLSENDSRWNVIEQAVDDRKPNENLEKSRYSTISYYVHNDGNKYNDITFKGNRYYDILIENNIPENISKHVSYLFERDPIIMYKKDIEDIKNNNCEDTSFFTNINSSNWNNVRLKPPSGENDGWKVEVRVLEMQTTTFGNTAFIIFINLLSKILFYYKLNLYIPITEVDSNFKKAFKHDSVKSMYSFRKNIFDDESNFVDKSLKEIVDILLKYIYNYLEIIDVQLKNKLAKYLEYIRGLSDGTIKTDAKKMRDFVKKHPDYNKDSIVTQQISDDLIERILTNKL